MIYAARFETMNALLGYLTDNCCGGKPDQCAPTDRCAPAPRGDAARAEEGNGVNKSGERAMKRMHVHVAVDDVSSAIGFYSALFARSRP